MNLSLGNKIKMLRMNQEISQLHLANLVGVMPAAISKYESDRVSISADMIIKLANALNTTPDYLLGFTEKELTEISKYSKEDIDLLDLISQLPINRKYEIKGYIKGILSNK